MWSLDGLTLDGLLRYAGLLGEASGTPLAGRIVGVLFDVTKYPISIGVLTFNSSYSADYGTTFAAYVITSAPLLIFFAFTTRRFMAGLQGGSGL